MRIKPVIVVLFLFVTPLVYADKSVSTTSYNESKADSLYDIVQNPDIPYSDKIATISCYGNISLYPGYFRVLEPLYNSLLSQAKHHSDAVGEFLCYNAIASLYLGLWNREKTLLYLDSAGLFVNQIDDYQRLVSYYRVKAQYIQKFFPDQSPEAVRNYRKAFEYYLKSEKSGQQDEVAIMLHNLSIYGIQRNDTAYLQKNIDAMNELGKSYSSSLYLFSLMDIKAGLNEAYYRNSGDESFLDSVIGYKRKCLAVCEKDLSHYHYYYTLVDLYVVIADALSKKANPDFALIDSLLSIAQAKSETTDSIGVARLYHTKARTFFKRNMIDSAEVMAIKSSNYLKAGYGNNYYSGVKANVELMREIYSEKGDYKKVIEYNDLWTKADEKIRANEVNELELQYEFDTLDNELKSLIAEKFFQERRYRMIFVICLLLCLVTLFFYLFVRSKKRSINGQIALIDVEKEETKLKLKLKEEKAIKVQLEKYEVLSDFHLKEMELIGKDMDLEQLYRDKEDLDKQVELYRQKLEAYELLNDRDGKNDLYTYNILVEDLKRLINKQLPDKGGYIEKLERLNKSYLDALNEKSVDNLSISYLKYCICFAIGMDISDVAECFNIEQSSVHMLRYRLKKKFGLGNNSDDNLDLFLQKISQS